MAGDISTIISSSGLSKQNGNNNSTTNKPKLLSSSDAEHLAHCSGLLTGLNSLRTRRELCDVVLRCGKVVVYGHRVVLSACSRYFDAMFTGNVAEEQWCERQKDEIELFAIDGEALEILIDFMYTGQASISVENVQSVLAGANLLQMQAITDRCTRFLIQHLDCSNCVGIAKLADIYSLTLLNNEALYFISQNIEEVMVSEEFLHFPVDNVALILRRDDLRVKSEESVYQATQIWMRYNIKSRLHHLEKLLSCVRLPLLSVGFLTTCYESNPLLKESCSAQRMFNDTLQYLLVPEKRLSHKLAKCLSTRPRQAPAALCVIGGKKGLFSKSNSVEIYLPNKNTWIEAPSLPAARFDCAAASLNEVVYLIGGIISASSLDTETLPNYVSDNSAIYWTPSTNSWRNITPMHKSRSSFAIAVLNGEIYCLGGYDGRSYLRAVEKYCVKTDKWTQVCPMLHGRSSFSVAVLDGFLYAIGGYGRTYLNSVEKYEPSTNTWTIVASIDEHRFGFGVGVVHGFIYVIGGHNGQLHLNSVERYCPMTNKWAELKPLNIPRTGHSVAVIDDMIYSIGGHSGANYLDLVQRYNPYNDEWTNVCPMPSARCNFALTAL